MVKSNLWHGTVFVSLIIIHMLFSWSYISLIGPNFGYMGFEMTFDPTKVLMSSVIIVLLSAYISLLKEDFYKIISCLLFIFVSSPNSVIFSYMQENWGLYFWSIVCVPVTVVFTKILPIFKLPVLSEVHKVKFLSFSMLFLFILVFASHGLHLNWKVFLLEDIYDVRLAARQSNSTVSVYAYFILAKVICPVAIIYSLEKKKYTFLYVSLIILTYLFMTTGHKSVYFTMFVLLGFSIGKDSYKDKINLLLWGAIVLFCLCRILSSLDVYMPESLFIRRLFFIPALLNLYFLDYFEHVKLFYSGSFMGGLIDYPLDRVPAREIGYVYFGSEEMSANNGYISDGYANLGHFGILFTILITSWVYKFFWKYNVPARYFGLIFVTFYAFQGSGLSTALITHGALLLSLMIPLFLRRKN